MKNTKNSTASKKDNVKEKEEEYTKFSKNKVITLIIVFISLILIVYVAFMGIGSRPAVQMNKEAALNTFKSIQGSSWLLDTHGISNPLASRGADYEKIFVTTDIEKEKLILPIYLYLDREEEEIGQELGIIQFDEETTLLKAHLPDGRVYDFAYSIAKNGQMENIAFISKDNKRTFYIKESLTKKVSEV